MGDELRTKRRDLGGSAKSVDIIEDTNSAVVAEVVDQLNHSRIPVKGERFGGGNGTHIVTLFSADKDMWVRSASFLNRGLGTLASATSSLALKSAIVGAQDFEAPTLTNARELFKALSFDSAVFPVSSVRNTTQFDAGVLGNTITGNPEGMIVKAGEVLYAEFVNAEGANRFFDVYAHLAPIDRINHQPGSGRGASRVGLSDIPLIQQREFLVTERGTN